MKELSKAVEVLTKVNYEAATQETKKLIDFLNENQVITLSSSDKKVYLLNLISNKDLHGIKGDDEGTLAVLDAIDSIWENI